MRQKQIEKHVREQLLSHLSGWQVYKNLLFQVPIGPCLTGVLLESSAFAANVVYPTLIVQPLYANETPPFTYRRRIPGVGEIVADYEREAWTRILRGIQKEAGDFFATIDTPAKIANRLDHASVSDPYEMEIVALSNVWIENRGRAIAAFDAASAMWRHQPPRFDWELKLLERLSQARGDLERDFTQFRSRLPRWREANLQHMSLLRWASEASFMR